MNIYAEISEAIAHVIIIQSNKKSKKIIDNIQSILIIWMIYHAIDQV